MTTRFSDEQLTAYLDGEKNHTPHVEIETALKTDESLRSRLESLKMDTDALSSSMDSLLDLAPAAPKLEIVEKTQSDTSWMKSGLIAACAACFMIVSGILGYNISDRKIDDWREYVAAYHYLYITNTLANVEPDPAQRQIEIARIGDAIGKDIELESLKNFAGLDYKRAQILGYEGKPLAQMTFLSMLGDPIALCIIRSETNSEKLIATMQMENMASASWAKDGYEYLIIGGKDEAMIKEAAEFFAAKI